MIQISAALIISITAMILITRYLNLHAFFSLLIAAVIFGLIVGKSFLDILTAMQSGFGSLLAQIGFLVAIGSCLGIVMEKTGAMEVISQQIISVFGTKRSVLAMTVIGVLVGIPVFADSGFIILSRLIPSIASQASLNSTQLSLALSTGLYTTHTRADRKIPRVLCIKEKPLGNDLLSQEVALQVPSALTPLTTGFGMCPGVPTSLKSPRDFIHLLSCPPLGEVFRIACRSFRVVFLKK